MNRGPHKKNHSLGKQPIWHNNNNIYIYILWYIYIIYKRHYHCHQGSTGPTGNPMTNPFAPITFDLSSRKYWTHRKPNDEPLYIQHLWPVIREVLALQETQWRTPLHPTPSTCHLGSTGPIGNPMTNPSTSMQSPIILPVSENTCHPWSATDCPLYHAIKNSSTKLNQHRRMRSTSLVSTAAYHMMHLKGRPNRKRPGSARSYGLTHHLTKVYPPTLPNDSSAWSTNTSQSITATTSYSTGTLSKWVTAACRTWQPW